MILKEYEKDALWILEYPISYFGINMFGRMTVIKLSNGELLIHDPCKINKLIKRQLDKLGEVKYIIAPGSYRHHYVTDFQQWFPAAETFLCPGIERKRNDIPFEWILGNQPDPRWSGELEQVVIQGTRYMWEVAFFHVPTKTLILVDLLKNIGDDYEHSTSLLLRFCWKRIFRMWNEPKASPKYRLGWGNKQIVRSCLNKILTWNAKRLILAHGNTMNGNINSVLEHAWVNVLSD